MNRYRITVGSLGYEDCVTFVDASSKQLAQLHAPIAVRAWLALNDLDEDSFELPFVRVSSCGKSIDEHAGQPAGAFVKFLKESKSK